MLEARIRISAAIELFGGGISCFSRASERSAHWDVVSNITASQRQSELLVLVSSTLAYCCR